MTTLYRKKPIPVQAHQWHKNGDHPDDRVGKQELDVAALLEARPELIDDEAGEIGPVPEDAPTYTRLEGAVVRFFRRPEPEYVGTKTHDRCGHIWHNHGWMDTLEGGHTVCPSDWIVTGIEGERWPVKDSIFRATYEPIQLCDSQLEYLNKSAVVGDGVVGRCRLPMDHGGDWHEQPQGGLPPLRWSVDS